MINEPVAVELDGFRYVARQLANGTWDWQRTRFSGKSVAMGEPFGCLERQQPEQALKELLSLALRYCSLY